MPTKRPLPPTTETGDSKHRSHGSKKKKSSRSITPPLNRSTTPPLNKNPAPSTASPVLIDNILELPSPPPTPRHPTVMADTGSANEGWAAWAVQEEFEKVAVDLSNTAVVSLPSNIFDDPPIARGPPKMTQGPPKITQEPPKITQEPPKITQEPPKITQQPPKITQEPPKFGNSKRGLRETTLARMAEMSGRGLEGGRLGKKEDANVSR